VTISNIDFVNNVSTTAYGITVYSNPGLVKIIACNFKYTAGASGSVGIYLDSNNNVIVYRCYLGAYQKGFDILFGDAFLYNNVEWSAAYKPTYSVYANTAFVKITTAKPASTSGTYEGSGSKILDYTE